MNASVISSTHKSLGSESPPHTYRELYSFKQLDSYDRLIRELVSENVKLRADYNEMSHAVKNLTKEMDQVKS